MEPFNSLVYIRTYTEYLDFGLYLKIMLTHREHHRLTAAAVYIYVTQLRDSLFFASAATHCVCNLLSPSTAASFSLIVLYTTVYVEIGNVRNV